MGEEEEEEEEEDDDEDCGDDELMEEVGIMSLFIITVSPLSFLFFTSVSLFFSSSFTAPSSSPSTSSSGF